MKEGYSTFYDELEKIASNVEASTEEFPSMSIDASFITPMANNYDVGDFYAQTTEGIEFPDTQIWNVTSNKIVRAKTDIFYQ